jgi:hypothetical protein
MHEQQRLRQRQLSITRRWRADGVQTLKTRLLLRSAVRVCAALLATSAFGCQLIIGLDDYYLAPACPPNAALCTVCNTPADCDPADACHTWSCVQHLCQPVNAKAGAPCNGGVCSDASPSTCVACNQDTDCPSGAYCDEHACYRCDDGVQNGDEIDVDCGGHCLQCPGIPCSKNAECKTGFCSPDGICCKSACDQPCVFCDSTGSCTDVPQYQTDWAATTPCGGGKVCDGGGGCRLDNGFTCVAAPECASFNCACADPMCNSRKCAP